MTWHHLAIVSHVLQGDEREMACTMCRIICIKAIVQIETKTKTNKSMGWMPTWAPLQI